LRRSERILLSSHTAGSTLESFDRMAELLADNVRRAVTGEPVRNVVNGADAIVRRR
jgi:phosphoglycerate dehydrogenase-like enzyme